MGSIEMEIQRALQIAEREWENIKTSLEKYGDIGEFDSIDYLNGRIASASEDSLLVRNLIEMDNKFATHGYFTQEAAYVFAMLASKAAKRLGLICSLAQTFGCGYSWIRTGYFDSNRLEKQHIIKQLFFLKIFFPLGVYFNRYFDSPEVKTKLRVVLHMFARWQDNPMSYIEDVERYREQLEPLWRGLSLALDSDAADRIKTYPPFLELASICGYKAEKTNYTRRSLKK